MTFKVKDGISIAGTTFVDGSRNITAGNITAGTVTAALSGNASTATNVAWSGITSKPTTISGFGITDAPTSTGTGASGTWSISITGNAATVTNGVYTTGSYADPAWITSLAKSKVGLANVENTALSTWPGTTNITTIGAATATSLNTGSLSIDGKKVLDLTSNGADRGPWNPIVTGIRQSGRGLHWDEDFSTGSNSIVVYNNNGGSAVVHLRTNTGLPFGAPPNTSGYVIKISYVTGQVPGSTPGWGGFVQSFTGAENQTFVQIFQALLPVGRNLVIAENSQGVGSTSYWLTDNIGTGKFEWYARVTHCGDSGTFSTGGHIWVDGGTDSSFDWYLASCNVYQTTNTSTLDLANLLIRGNQALHAGNYSSYSPTLTGSGASGTWGISISGNAATATNGVVTTGSYADPAWITSLAKSKVGLTNVENTALSTWAGSTNLTTLGAATATSISTTDNVRASKAVIAQGDNATWTGKATFLDYSTANDWGRFGAYDYGTSTWKPIRTLSPTTIDSSLTVTGNLTVNGTTTTVNSTTVTIDDPIFTLGGDTAPTADDNKDRGIEFRWHNGTAAKVGFFGFDDSTGYFTFIPDATNTSEVFSGTQGDIQATNFRGNLVGNASTVTNGIYTTTGGLIYTRTGVSTNSTDFNTITTAGVYSVSGNGAWTGSTNGPTSAYQYGLLEVFTDASNIVTQRYVTHSGSETWIRSKFNAGDWQAWRQVLTSTNYNSFSPTLTGGGATGTWAISISGTAANASAIDNVAFNNSNSGSPVSAPDTLDSNGIGYVTNISLLGQTDGALYSQAYSASWQHQIYGDYRTGQIALRGKNNGTWQAWRTVLDSTNYNSYSPTLIGTGASGTWGINITGNAATATTWQTGRTLTIGNTGKSVNGSVNVSWTHSELGVTRDLGTVAVQGVAGSSQSCTTAQFITWLTSIGAFSQTSCIMKCSWDYAGNNDISDTGFGSLEMAGCIIEVSSDGTQYIIRVTSPSTGTGAGGIHEYVNHGTSYSPGWRRVYTSSLNGSITGNAGTATTLQTARLINGTSFDGSAGITTANWGTARTITVGSTGKSVNGSSDVSWSLAEIGALGVSAKAADSNLLDGYDSTAFSGPVSVVKQFFWNDLTAVSGQAKTYEIARIGIDYNDWNSGTGPFEVELYEAYYSRGLKKKYVIHWGYTNTYGIQLVEYSGSGDNNFQVRLGSPVLVSGDNYYLPVFIDVRYYSMVDVRVTTNRNITTSNPPAIQTTYINPSPTGTDIADFTADSTVNFSSTTAVQVNGNQLLHAANYNSYAPTLTGTGASGNWGINITGNAATVTNGLYTSGNQTISGVKTFYSPNNTFINTVSTSNQGLSVFQETAGADAYMTFHISNDYAVYFGLGGAENDLVVGGWSAGNNRYRLLHTGNYNSYAPTLTGTGASGTWGINITGNAGSASTAAKTSATTVPASTAFSKWLFATTSTSGTLDWNDSSNTIPGVGSTLLLGSATNGPGGSNYYHPLNIEYSGIDGVGNVTQMAVAYGTPGNELYMRGRYGGGWSSWTRFLNSGNYNSYSPTLTGGGASGTWGINITGNAATVTNGVYLDNTQTLTNKTLSGPVLTSYQETVTTTTVSTTTYNIDTSLGNIFEFTLTTNVTFTFTNPVASGRAKPITVILKQDATGGRTATFTGARYTDGQLPQLSTGANQIDVLTFYSTNGGSWYFGTFAMANVS